jgi:hypothetical protein
MSSKKRHLFQLILIQDIDIDIDLQNDYLLNESMLILSDYLYLSTNLLLSEAA